MRSPKHSLTRHVRGGWYKSINGIWTLVAGKLEAPTPEDADAVYERKFAALWAGAVARPAAVTGAELIGDLFDQFIHAKRQAVAAGNLTKRTLDEYIDAMQSFADSVGTVRYCDLVPFDFTRVHQAWAAKFGVHRLSKYVACTRTAFNWLAAQDLIAGVPKYGDFRQPTRAQFRRHRGRLEADRGAKLFNAGEIAALLDHGDEVQRAQILLAINGGFGNTDLSSLRLKVIDLECGWIDYRRAKTGIRRRCPLWPETLAAIRTALPACKITGNVFSTSDGRPLVQGTHDRLAARFKTLCTAAGCYVEDRGFYALRATFRTLADEATDQRAAALVMGHEVGDMADMYVRGLADERLCRMVDHVRHAALGEWSGARLEEALRGARTLVA